VRRHRHRRAARSVKLDAKKLTLIPGQKVFLAETISPPNAENKSVTWTSSKPKVATSTPTDR
jgi:uncharacterized protein YjdB